MEYRVIVQPEALQNLKSIYDFITQKDSQTKATLFLRELEHSIASLSEMPLRCRKSFYTDDALTRDLIYKGYTIVFQIQEDMVHILMLFRQK